MYLYGYNSFITVRIERQIGCALLTVHSNTRFLYRKSVFFCFYMATVGRIIPGVGTARITNSARERFVFLQ